MLRKQYNSIFCLFGALFYCYTATGQTPNFTFQRLPLEMQLFQRDLRTNKATTTVTGVAVQTSEYTQVEARLTNESGAEVFSVRQNLQYTNGRASFSLQVDIPAGCNNHRLEIRGFKPSNGLWIAERRVEKLLAGDVFIITGQSNAIAWSSPNFGDLDEYTRSWHPPFGWGPLNLSFPGQWGARLAKRISNDIKIPVAIFNEAAGANSISAYLRDDSLKGNYGSLLRRFDSANAPRRARAGFWFHGEADAWGMPTATYVNLYRRLTDAWREDYGIERAYLYQMRFQSCNSPFPLIMEAHRQCGDLPNVDVMSTTNARHDSCHFYYDGGYQTLGDRMFDMIANTFYGRNTPDVLPPDVERAFRSGPREITVVVKNTSALRLIGSPWVDFRTEGATIPIESGVVDGNTIRLTLGSALTNAVTGISYLGHTGNANRWLVNSRGVGLLTFHNIPIQTSNSRILPDELPVSIFPNPAYEVLYADLEGLNGAEGRLSISDALGRILFDTRVDRQTTVVEVPVGAWSKGVYTVEIHLNNGQRSVRQVAVR